MNVGTVLLAATTATGFWRCGKFFPKEGIVVDIAEFTEEQWERLKAEGMLKISKATKAVKENLEERAGRIAEAIQSLTAEDFQRDGKPRLEALNDLLADDLGKIMGAERDLVWDELKDGGFEAPKEEN